MNIEIKNQEQIELETETTNATNIETKNQSSVDLEIGTSKGLNLNTSNKSSVEYEIGKNKNTSGGTDDHDKLQNRDKENQHPIKAITGLEDALANAGGIKGVEVNNANVVDANGVAKISVPRKLSQLENDTGYVNKLSTSLEYYYTKNDVDKKISALPLGTEINTYPRFLFDCM